MRRYSRLIKITVGILITLLALWLSFRKVDWNTLLKELSQVKLLWVAASLAGTLVTLYLLGWRWRILLKPKRTVSMGRLFRLNVISQYTNIIVPARLGEVARAYLASKENRISGGFVMGTVAIEKILDFLVFLALWILIPVFFAFQNEFQGYGAALVIAFLLTLLLILFIWRPQDILKGTAALSKILPAGKVQERVQGVITGAVESFQLLKSGKMLAWLMFVTLVLVAGQAFSNFLLFQAFQLKLSFWAGLVVLLAIQVANVPPSVPGKLGVFEYATILALGLCFGSSCSGVSPQDIAGNGVYSKRGHQKCNK